MATRMNHCTTCQKHFFLTEQQCPHCGAAVSGGRLSRFVRQARMGGLMLFTALTTTACYGSPALMDPPNAPSGPLNAEPREKKQPTELGVGYLFITPKAGERERGQTLRLEKAKIEGAKLVVASTDGYFKLVVEAPDAAAFAELTGVREALNVDQVKMLELEGSFPSGSGGERTLVTMGAPGTPGLTGVLQLSRVDASSIGGTLLLSANGQTVQLYFLAAR